MWSELGRFGQTPACIRSSCTTLVPERSLSIVVWGCTTTTCKQASSNAFRSEFDGRAVAGAGVLMAHGRRAWSVPPKYWPSRPGQGKGTSASRFGCRSVWTHFGNHSMRHFLKMPSQNAGSSEEHTSTPQRSTGNAWRGNGCGPPPWASQGYFHLNPSIDLDNGPVRRPLTPAL